MGKRINEAELLKIVKGVQDGNEHDMVKLYEKTCNIIFSMVKKRIHDNELAKDTVQEIYISVFKSIKSFDETQSSFTTWLTAITNKRTIDQIRKLYRQKIESALDELPCTDILEDDLLDKEQLHRLIKQLTPSLQSVVIEYYINDKTTAEIAKQLDISESSVRTQLSRARQSLRLKLIDEDEKTNKIFGLTLVPSIDLFADYMKNGTLYQMTGRTMLNVFNNVGASTGITSTSMITKAGLFIMATTKTKVVTTCIVAAVIACGVGIPVYIHNGNQKAEQAVMAMAAIEMERLEAETEAERGELAGDGYDRDTRVGTYDKIDALGEITHAEGEMATDGANAGGSGEMETDGAGGLTDAQKAEQAAADAEYERQQQAQAQQSQQQPAQQAPAQQAPAQQQNPPAQQQNPPAQQQNPPAQQQNPSAGNNSGGDGSANFGKKPGDGSYQSRNKAEMN